MCPGTLSQAHPPGEHLQFLSGVQSSANVPRSAGHAVSLGPVWPVLTALPHHLAGVCAVHQHQEGTASVHSAYHFTRTLQCLWQ